MPRELSPFDDHQVNAVRIGPGWGASAGNGRTILLHIQSCSMSNTPA